MVDVGQFQLLLLFFIFFLFFKIFCRLSKFFYALGVVINKSLCRQDHNDQMHDAFILTPLWKVRQQSLIIIDGVLLLDSCRKFDGKEYQINLTIELEYYVQQYLWLVFFPGPRCFSFVDMISQILVLSASSMGSIISSSIFVKMYNSSMITVTNRFQILYQIFRCSTKLLFE